MKKINKRKNSITQSKSTDSLNFLSKIKNIFKTKSDKTTNYSKEYKKFLKKKKVYSGFVLLSQILLLVSIIAVWEFLASRQIINILIFSSPSRVWDALVSNNFFLSDAWVTLSEALIGFAISTVVGSLIAVVLWWNETIRRILDPYIVILNSLPKIALGPIIIIWFGVGKTAIIVMAILIMIIITILSMLQAFTSCDENKVLLLKSMNATKLQIFTKLILPNSLQEFISVLKINVGLTWVGTIMGEYLVSSEGLGYQISYNSLFFKMNIVMANIIVLCVLSAGMYFLIAWLEKTVKKNSNR